MRHLADNSAVQPAFSNSASVLNDSIDECCEKEEPTFKRMKKEFKLIDEGKEVADSSDDSFDQYSFLKSSQMIDIMLQKSGSPQSEDAKEDELPAMPVYKADTNYFELYW